MHSCIVLVSEHVRSLYKHKRCCCCMVLNKPVEHDHGLPSTVGEKATARAHRYVHVHLLMVSNCQQIHYYNIRKSVPETLKCLANLLCIVLLKHRTCEQIRELIGMCEGLTDVSHHCYQVCNMECTCVHMYMYVRFPATSDQHFCCLSLTV